jgi:hypothetical protein
MNGEHQTSRTRYTENSWIQYDTTVYLHLYCYVWKGLGERGKRREQTLLTM